MWKILQYKKPDDWIVANNKEQTVKEFIEIVSKKLKIDLKWSGNGVKEKGIDKKRKDYYRYKSKIFRPSEVDYLKGDYSKAKKYLKWKPSISTSKISR